MTKPLPAKALKVGLICTIAVETAQSSSIPSRATIQLFHIDLAKSQEYVRYVAVVVSVIPTLISGMSDIKSIFSCMQFYR